MTELQLVTPDQEDQPTQFVVTARTLTNELGQVIFERILLEGDEPDGWTKYAVQITIALQLPNGQQISQQTMVPIEGVGTAIKAFVVAEDVAKDAMPDAKKQFQRAINEKQREIQVPTGYKQNGHKQPTYKDRPRISR